MLVVFFFKRGEAILEVKIFDKYESIFDHYITSHPAGDILQTTAWGQLKSSTGWKPFPLAVLKNGQIQAATLILKRPLPKLKASIFYSPRGPVFSDYQSLTKLIEAGKELAKSHTAIFWKMDPGIVSGNPVWNQLSDKLHKIETGLDFDSVQPRFIMELDIKPSLDAILANMKSKTRYNIRYAQRQDVKVVLCQSKLDLEVFYPILEETAIRDGFKIRAFEYFENLWDSLMVPKLAQLFIAYHKNQPLSGAIAFRLGKRAWYVYGGSSNQKRNLQPNYAIQWEMIKWAKGSGCQTFDFRGVSGNLDPEGPLYGLYRFKEGFGAQLIEYVGEYDLALSPIYKLWNPAIKIYTRLRKTFKG